MGGCRNRPDYLHSQQTSPGQHQHSCGSATSASSRTGRAPYRPPNLPWVLPWVYSQRTIARPDIFPAIEILDEVTPPMATKEQVTPELVTLAEHARRCGVSRKSATVWRQGGQLVMVGGLVDFARSYRGERWHGSLKAQQRREGWPGVADAADRRQPPARPAPMKLPASAWADQLHALDWTTTPDWSSGAVHARVIAAAQAVGLEAVESDARDDGHHGAYQLRDTELLKRHGRLCRDAIAAGFGFELDAWDALHACRRCVIDPDDDPDEPLTLRPNLLHLLAFPFGECHHRPTT